MTILWVGKALKLFTSWQDFLPFKGQHITLLFSSGSSAFRYEKKITLSFTIFLFYNDKKTDFFTHTYSEFFVSFVEKATFIYSFFIVTVKMKFAFPFTLTFQCLCAISKKMAYFYEQFFQRQRKENLENSERDVFW